MITLQISQLKTSLKLVFALSFLCTWTTSFSQIKPPGYEREVQQYKEQQKISPLERDSVTLVDTIFVFDPETAESTMQIISTNYSIKDYCKNFLAITDPDMLLDGKPHTIIDPNTYEDIVIRLNASGKIDTIPQ